MLLIVECLVSLADEPEKEETDFATNLDASGAEEASALPKVTFEDKVFLVTEIVELLKKQE